MRTCACLMYSAPSRSSSSTCRRLTCCSNSRVERRFSPGSSCCEQLLHSATTPLSDGFVAFPNARESRSQASTSLDLGEGQLQRQLITDGQQQLGPDRVAFVPDDFEPPSHLSSSSTGMILQTVPGPLQPAPDLRRQYSPPTQAIQLPWRSTSLSQQEQPGPTPPLLPLPPGRPAPALPQLHNHVDTAFYNGGGLPVPDGSHSVPTYYPPGAWPGAARPSLDISIPRQLGALQVQPVGQGPERGMGLEELVNFSWEQEVSMVKIYVPMLGVRTEYLRAVFEPTSLEIKVFTPSGRNYRFAVKPLFKAILCQACRVVASKTRKNILITLQKLRYATASEKHWEDIYLHSPPHRARQVARS